MTVRVDVPEDQFAVFGEDGRVFFDLDRLVEVYKPAVEQRAFGAKAVGDDFTIGLAEGQAMLLDEITRSREVITLEDGVNR